MNKTEELKQKIKKLDLYPIVVPSEFYYKENPSLKHWQDIKKSKLLDLIKQSNREAVRQYEIWRQKEAFKLVGVDVENLKDEDFYIDPIAEYFNSLEKGTNNE